MRRQINIYNNYIYTVNTSLPALLNIINTNISIHNNEYHIQMNLFAINNDSIIPFLKYILENKSIILENNIIYLDTDNYLQCMICGIWKNNKILNNTGKTYNRYKQIYLAGISDNNVFEVTNFVINFGEVKNTSIDRALTSALFTNYKVDTRKIKLCNVTINSIALNSSLPDDFIIEFDNCTLKHDIHNVNITYLECSNTTLIFNACNFITDNNILMPYKLFNDKSNNVKLILKNCLYNGNPIDNTVRLSNIEKKIVCIKRGTTEERPFYVEDDFLYYDTTLKKYIRWNGEKWTNIDGTDLDTPTDEWTTIE